jgi:glycosyltransferase involved in cell wall biosynthesis
MRILLVTDWLRRGGGMERYFETLRDGLRAAGHDARLLTSTAGTAAGGTADYRALGSNSTTAQAFLQVVNPFAVAGVRAAVRDLRPELALVGMVEQHLSPAVLSVLGSVPTLLSVGDYKPVCPIHSKLLPSDDICEVPAGLVCWRGGCVGLAHWLRDRPRYALFRFGIARADRVLACSAWLQHSLAAAGIRAEAIVLPSPRPSPDYVRAPTATPRFVFVGRLSREKGVASLIRAFARAREAVPAAELRIVGDGDERPSLEQLSASLGQSASISFRGSLPLAGVERELAPAWASVVPSLWAEPLGLVAVEAIVRGVPVIASSSGGLAEVVERGRTGLLFPNRDETALARCLEDIATGRAFPERALPADVVREVAARHGIERHVARLETIAGELRAQVAPGPGRRPTEDGWAGDDGRPA